MSEMVAAQTFDMGRVIRETFQILGRHLVPFLILSLILVGLPAILSSYATFGFPLHPTSRSPFGWQYFASLGLTTFGGILLNAAVIQGAINDLTGRTVGVGEGLAVALRRLLPLLAVALLAYFGLVIGFLFLIVPGLMLLTAWIALVPALVVERTGVIGAFRRSAELTRGKRLWILGLLLLYLVGLLILMGITGGLNNAVRVSGGAAPSLISTYLIGPVIGSVNSLVGAIGAAVLYIELRRVSDGVGPAGLADVFD